MRLSSLSYRDRCLDGGMRVVVQQLKIIELKIEDRAHCGVEVYAWPRPRGARQLRARLFEVVAVEVRIAEGMDEIAGFESGHLGHHQREQGIGGYIERHAEENIGAALVELTGEPPVRHVELEESMARWQRHAVYLPHIPGAYDQAAGVRVFADFAHHGADLVDMPAIRARPAAPLRPVYRSEFTVFIRPLIPDRHAIVAQVANVGGATQN